MKFLLLVAFACVAFATQPPAFSAYEFFVGEWDVEYSSSDQKIQFSLEEDSQVQFEFKDLELSIVEESIHFSIRQVNGTDRALSVEYRFEDQGLWPHTAMIFLESGLSGKIINVEQADEEEEEEDPGVYDMLESLENTLPFASFTFENHSNGYFVARGTLADDAFYQLAVAHASHPAFLMFIVKRSSDGTVLKYETFSGKKFVPPRQPSFFQKYGTFLMLGGLMLFTQFRSRPQHATEPEPQARRREDDGPQIEQLPDSDSTPSDKKND